MNKKHIMDLFENENYSPKIINKTNSQSITY